MQVRPARAGNLHCLRGQIRAFVTLCRRPSPPQWHSAKDRSPHALRCAEVDARQGSSSTMCLIGTLPVPRSCGARDGRWCAGFCWDGRTPSRRARSSGSGLPSGSLSLPTLCRTRLSPSSGCPIHEHTTRPDAAPPRAAERADADERFRNREALRQHEPSGNQRITRAGNPGRAFGHEAVGISVPCAGFKTLPVWLEISFRVSVVRCY
jgi:hypothetical protein